MRRRQGEEEEEGEGTKKQNIIDSYIVSFSPRV